MKAARASSSRPAAIDARARQKRHAGSSAWARGIASIAAPTSGQARARSAARARHARMSAVIESGSGSRQTSFAQGTSWREAW